MSNLTAQLAPLSNSALVGLYNKVADTPIKRFRNHDTAVRRTATVLEESGKANELLNGKSRVKLPDDLTITVVSETNPKRPNSAAFGRFATYQTGMTVGEYLAKSGGTRQDLKWDSERGFIKLS